MSKRDKNLEKFLYVLLRDYLTFGKCNEILGVLIHNISEKNRNLFFSDQIIFLKVQEIIQLLKQ